MLDSYDNPTYADGQAAAIYGQQPPMFNASRPPGEWQTYDIFFEAPKFDDKGELKEKAYVTVIHNGIMVQNRHEILGHTNHKQIGDYKGAKETGPIQLYEHGNPVRFRNIWIRPLGEYDTPEKSNGVMDTFRKGSWLLAAALFVFAFVRAAFFFQPLG